MDNLEHRVNELEKTQAAAEEQHKTLFRRVDNLEKEQKTMQAFAVSLEKLANAVGSTEKKVDGLCKDVEAIKAKPGKRWETLGMDVLKIVVGALLGFLFVKLGIG
jgi:DNA repair ATPase RecN